MSWLSSFSKAASDLTQRAGDLTSSIAEKAKKAIPIDAATLEKLTLTTPELKAERERIDAEEKHKIAVMESLSGMYPWETKDEEREILVDECKEAILALSDDDATFFGPYLMPAPTVNVEDETRQEQMMLEVEEESDTMVVKERKPTAEQLEQLSKLEPLPPLLRDFDLDAHVGLIQKLLSVDTKLVVRQSTLSGGGERERIFWQNYFFHCAFTRYEAGLSVDEIWSDEHSPVESKIAIVAEEEITFDDAPHSKGVHPPSVSTQTEGTAVKSSPLFSQMFPSVEADDDVLRDLSSTPPDYELVDESSDPELDELEAEIARELEN